MTSHSNDLDQEDPTPDPDARRTLTGALLLFGVVTLLAISDVAIDLAAGTSISHVAWESTIVVSGAAGVVYLLLRLRDLRRRAKLSAARADELAQALDRSREEAERWRQEAREALDGLGVAIDAQFDRWSLTPAEREVAMFLLKGLSHKEIAGIRGVGVATVRQQAQSAYRKAGLSGRADLSAFFLEDLLLPSRTTEA